jgi:excisionase family DNA binding protein
MHLSNTSAQETAFTPETEAARKARETPVRETPVRETPRERQLVFTSSEAARYLGVSLATIRRWADAGYLSCYRTPGSQRRFSRRQLDEFIASMQRPSHSEVERRAA